MRSEDLRQYAEQISAVACKIWPLLSHLETPGAASDVLACLMCMVLRSSDINGPAEARMAIEEFGNEVLDTWWARLDS